MDETLRDTSKESTRGSKDAAWEEEHEGEGQQEKRWA